MNRGGRGRISCTPAVQPRVLWLISRGWSLAQAGRVYGMSDNAIARQAVRDPEFRRRLDRALAHRSARRPIAVHTSTSPARTSADALSPTAAAWRRVPEKTATRPCNGARTDHLEETG